MAITEASAHRRTPGWRATLTLGFAADDGRTVVAARQHTGPLCIQKPFYPEDGVCHVYVLHPPGGIAGGDRLELDAELSPGSAVLITTPAATKFYRSEGPAGGQCQVLRVARDAALEWLPAETILFGGSRAEIVTDVQLDGGARFVGWEMLSLGRPLSGDHYGAGTLTQRTDIRIDGRPLLLERLRWTAGDPIFDAGWGLDGCTVWGALYVYPADAALMSACRAGRPLAAGTSQIGATGVTMGITQLDGLAVIRCLARDPEALRGALVELWSIVRRLVMGRAAVPPRIWLT